MSKVKIFYKDRMAGIDKIKQGLINKKTGIEKNMVMAETKLMAGTLNDEGFIRIRDRFDLETKNIQKQIDEIDSKRRVDVDIIREILMLTNDVYGSYKKAPPAMKRLWLSLFWEGFWVKDKQIVSAKPTKLIQQLIEERSVIITNNWLPSSTIFRKIISILENKINGDASLLNMILAFLLRWCDEVRTCLSVVK